MKRFLLPLLMFSYFAFAGENHLDLEIVDGSYKLTGNGCGKDYQKQTKVVMLGLSPDQRRSLFRFTISDSGKDRDRFLRIDFQKDRGKEINSIVAKHCTMKFKVRNKSKKRFKIEVKEHRFLYEYLIEDDSRMGFRPILVSTIKTPISKKSMAVHFPDPLEGSDEIKTEAMIPLFVTHECKEEFEIVLDYRIILESSEPKLKDDAELFIDYVQSIPATATIESCGN